MGTTNNYYAVAKGFCPGIYQTWDEARKQVHKFSNAKHKKFSAYSEAKQWIEANSSIPHSVDVSRPLKRARETETVVATSENESKNAKICAGSATKPTNDHEKSTEKSPTTCSDVVLKTILVQFDGGARGNPGLGGAGVACYVTQGSDETSKRLYRTIQQYIGPRCTNNEAEYHGCIGALKIVQIALQQLAQGSSQQSEATSAQSSEKVTVSIQGDSNLIIKQLRGEYRCSAPNLQSLYSEAKKSLAEINKHPLVFSVELKHIVRKYNGMADELANRAMDTKTTKEEIFEEFHPR